MQARSYDPSLSRFLSPDRFEQTGADVALQSDPLTQNRYVFAGGNPVSNVEWDGHVRQCDANCSAEEARDRGQDVAAAQEQIAEEEAQQASLPRGIDGGSTPANEAAAAALPTASSSPPGSTLWDEDSGFGARTAETNRLAEAGEFPKQPPDWGEWSYDERQDYLWENRPYAYCDDQGCGPPLEAMSGGNPDLLTILNRASTLMGVGGVIKGVFGRVALTTVRKAGGGLLSALLGADEGSPGGGTAAKGAGDTTRVGRWMSKEEHEAMLRSGRVQEGAGGVTSVARPANPASYQRQAPSGSRYVEFDVPTGSLRPGGRGDWAVIPGPNSIFNRQTGLFPELPSATCISWLACRR